MGSPSLAAFDAGWDSPPHFSWTACDLCPAVCVATGAPHAAAHARWAREGRPSEFTVEKCGVDGYARKLN